MTTPDINDAGLYMEGFEDDTIPPPPPHWYYDWIKTGVQPDFVKRPIVEFAWALATSACLHEDWLLPVIQSRLFDNHLMEFLVVLADHENDHVYNILVKAGLLKDIPGNEWLDFLINAVSTVLAKCRGCVCPV